MKRRYLKIDDVKTGDKIIFDNTSRYIKELPPSNYVGKVIEVIDTTNIKVKFILKNQELDIEIPFFLAQ